MIAQVEPVKYPFWKTTFALFLTGLVGVLSLLVMILPQVDAFAAASPSLMELPDAVIALIMMINPAILLLVAVVVGSLLAPKVNLRSLLAEKAFLGKALLPELRRSFLLAFTAGLILGPVIQLFDWALLPLTGLGSLEGPVEMMPLSQLLMGMLYGGITEEILLRWGFMSLLVWLGWALFQRSRTAPARGIVWGAILLSAIMFGIAHLPAMASLVPLTGWVLMRTVLLNALGGIVYGWLFWRYNLETAMVAHASTHIGFFIMSLVLSLVF
jgi:hypothetical protein